MNSSESEQNKASERNVAMNLIKGKKGYHKNDEGQKHLIWVKDLHSKKQISSEEAIKLVSLKRRVLLAKAKLKQATIKRARVKK